MNPSFLVISVAFVGVCVGAVSILDEALTHYNEELRAHQHEEAEVAWNISLGADPSAWDENKRLSIEKNLWKNKWCQNLLMLSYQPEVNVTPTDARQIYLACRGPRFTSFQLNSVLSVLTKMEKTYGATQVFSLRMEPGLNKLMETSRDESVLLSGWSQWHQKVGTELRPLYVNLVHKLNRGARNAGHSDFGEFWRGELETSDLKSTVMKLYQDVLPLYKLLHTYVRYKVGHFYKLNLTSVIPAHLLGNMWAQKWDSLMDIVYEERSDDGGNPMVEELISSRIHNPTALDLVETAEEFYQSMGFPHLPGSFYQKSFFTDDPHLPSKNCHGTAANMFAADKNDYRVMMCIEDKLTDEDLVTVTHEMGHVYYFMAYRNLQTLFQDGANTAFHESVGDCLTYGLKPLKDASGSVKIKDLLKIALTRLPQIGFGLVLDLWRWHVFENEDADPGVWNEHWWQLHFDILGVSPPAGYRTEGLDATAKYHVVQNIPYIRYFLSSFLQVQFFEALCQPKDMHECQLRGNKMAGYKLWKMMEKGSKEHWSIVLKEMTGSGQIESRPLLKYFEPLKIWLEEKVAAHKLHVGW